MSRWIDPKTVALLLATLTALGVLQLSENEQAELVQAVVALVGAALYIVNKLVEGAQRRPQPAERNLLTDAWQRMSIAQAEAHSGAAVDPLEQILTALIELRIRVERLEMDTGDGGTDRER